MKKIMIVFLGIAFLASCATLKPYDSDTVKMAMQNILSHAQSIAGAVESGDVTSASMDFKILKEEFHKLSRMEPPKGSGDEWKMIQEKMIELSMDGKKAAEMGNVEQVGAILGEIFALQKKGHGAFKG